MEEKDHAWVLRHLHTAGCSLPILDTSVFAEKQLKARYYSDSSNRIVRLAQPTESPIEACLNELLATAAPGAGVLGYILVHNERKAIEFSNTEEIRRLVSHIKIPLMQRVQSGVIPAPYTFSLSYTDSGYIPSFTHNGHSLDTASLLFDKAKDIASVTLWGIEKAAKQRVVKLIVDLFRDANYNLWLGRVLECKVIDLAELKGLTVQSVTDLAKLRLKTSLTRLNSYRGHTRPKLGSRIKQAVQPKRILAVDTLLKHPTKENFVEEAHEHRTKHQAETLSRHFVEMLCKTNVALTPNATPADTQQEFRRLVKYLQDKKLEIKGGDRVPFGTDLTVKVVEDRTNNIRTPMSRHSRSSKTPEQALHCIKAPNKPAEQYRKSRPVEEKPAQQRKLFTMKRKSDLIQKSLAKNTLSPMLSTQLLCYKPIRLVKAGTTSRPPLSS